LTVMLIHPHLLLASKIAATAIAGVAALVASLLAAGYAVALCGSSLQGAAVGIVFGGMALAMLITLGFVLMKLSWSLRALVGATLLVASFLLLPQPVCAAESHATAECG
jgi:hypothetical protein